MGSNNSLEQPTRNPRPALPNDLTVKITFQTPDRIELRGIPQGRGLLFGILCCLAIMLVAAFFTYFELVKAKSPWAAVPPAIGVVFMLVLMGILILLSFKRERLILDKVTQTAEHETWSLLIGTRKTKSYPFDRLAGVAVEKSLQARGGGRGFAVQVTKARLLITKPRRAIDLDEVQSGNPEPVIALATEISQFLGTPLKALGSHDEPPRKRKKQD